MLEYINNGDLVITTTNIKKQILKEISNKKLLINVKFMTLKEFVDNYFGSYDERAIYFLMKNYNLKYGIALEYLDNIFYNYKPLEKYYNELEKNNLLIKNNLFKKSLNKIVVIGYDLIDSYIKKALDQYETKYINFEGKGFKHKVYGFDKQTDEIVYIASSIREKLKTVSINDIYLINVNDDYKDEVKRIFKLFNLPINIEKSIKAFGTNGVQMFLKELEETKDVEKALSKIEKNEIYNKIVDVLNKYAFISNIDDVFISIIRNELKESKIRKPILKNAINITDIDNIEEGKIYYFLGFNQESVPTIYHDDELIKDFDRKELGLLTSLEKFQNSKNKIINFLNREKDVFISYKLKDNYKTYYPSPLIEEEGFEVIMNMEVELVYSNLYNKQKLVSLLDNYIKFNEKDGSLEKLLGTYPDIPYLTYDNGYNGIDVSDLYKYLDNKLRLSYSSMNNYFLCAFRFYIQNILKLDLFEESFAALIGSLFHECLSKMYDENFNLKEVYDDYLKEKDLSFKEQFFVSKLYSNLEFVIDTILKQESFSKFDKVLTEQNIMVDKSSKVEVSFVGIVDKIKYAKEDSKVLVAIIDYKTGNILTSLDNINYGLNLQLPVYIYLTKNGMHKNVEIVGFYLQKILNSPDVDSDDSSILKKLKLDGYTINNENLMGKFDSSYEKSEVIKGLGLTKNGFSSYSKLVSDEGIDKIVNIVDKKIDEVRDAVLNGEFSINPKRIDNKLVGCEYCNFKDLCFRKEEDIVNLENKKFAEIVGDDNA